jgi:hypothetical protein
MRKFCRAALLSLLTFLVLQPMLPFATTAAASDRRTSNSNEKKKQKKVRARKTKKILKGHHTKHATKPA